MDIIYVKKLSGRLYKSEDCLYAVCKEIELPDYQLSHDDSGAPVISGGPFISISDTKDYWCCVLSDKKAGIDIEEKRKVLPGIVRHFHKYEREYLSGLEEGGSEWTEELLSIWTRKEAYMKYCGEGLKMGLSSFSVIDKALDYKNIIDSQKGPDAFVYQVDAPYGLTAALCSASEAPEISYHECEYNGLASKPSLEKATDLLSIRMYSSKELKKKLLALSYSEEESEYAVSELIKRGYLNDEEYAASYIRHAASAGKGSKRIKNELKQKGISGADSEKVLAILSEEEPESERERAFKAVSKMPCTNEKEKARIARKLAGLGYESAVIYDTINRMKKA